MKCSLHVLIIRRLKFCWLSFEGYRKKKRKRKYYFGLNWVLFGFSLITCFSEGVREDEKSLGEGTANSPAGRMISSQAGEW